MADMRLQGALRPNLPQTGIAFVDHVHLVAVIGAPNESVDGKTLYQWIIRRNLRNLAAGKADDNDPALEIDTTKRRLERVAADRVVDDVGPTRVFEDFLADIFVRIIDPVIGPVGLGEIDFLVCARGGDNGGAHRLAELHRRQADAARGTMHQQDLARFKMRAIGQRHMTCPVRHRERRSGRPIHIVRDRGQVGRRYICFFRKSAVADRPHDPVANLNVINSVADSDHFTRRLHAGTERQVRFFLIFASYHQRVAEIHAGGMHGDLGFSGTRRIELEFLELHRVDAVAAV